MSTPLFSVVNYLNQHISTPDGLIVGVLIDIIGDERTGAFTFFIVEGQLGKLYAIHHSYFYQLNSPESMIFDQSLGDSDYDFFADLPTSYKETQVYTCSDLLHLTIPSLVTAEHRSDDESPF